MKLLILLLMASACAAGEPPVQKPDTVKVDSATLVIGSVEVGTYSYYVVTDSLGGTHRFVVFPAEVGAAFYETIMDAKNDEKESSFDYYKQRFLDTEKK